MVDIENGFPSSRSASAFASASLQWTPEQANVKLITLVTVEYVDNLGSIGFYRNEQK